MKTVDDYLDAALTRGSFPSDRQLAFALGLSQGAISLYRTGRAWPDDDTMIRIAEAAGYNLDQALLDLNTWRAKSPEAQAVYRRIAATISAAVFALTLLVPSPSPAKEPNGYRVNFKVPDLYIMRHSCVRRLRVCYEFPDLSPRNQLPADLA